VRRIDVDRDGNRDVDIVPAPDPAREEPDREDGPRNPGQGDESPVLADGNPWPGDGRWRDGSEKPGRGPTHPGATSHQPERGDGLVAHGTSNGNRTVDYAVAATPLDVGLGRFPDGGTLAYEYYEGPENGRAAPDEVWLHVRDEAGDDHLLWHTANDDFSSDGVPPDETWLTRNVHREILGEPDPEDNPGYFWSEMVDGSREPILESVDPKRLRENLWSEIVERSQQVILDGTGDDNVADLVDVFGADGRIGFFAIGAGGPRGDGTVKDVYFRNLRLDGDRVARFP
jgi:hypothetical protein